MKDIKRTHSSANMQIDVNNDDLMVSLGMRQPKYVGRNEEFWTKTPKERKILRKLRRHGLSK